MTCLDQADVDPPIGFLQGKAPKIRVVASNHENPQAPRSAMSPLRRDRTSRVALDLVRFPPNCDVGGPGLLRPLHVDSCRLVCADNRRSCTVLVTSQIEKADISHRRGRRRWRAQFAFWARRPPAAALWRDRRAVLIASRTQQYARPIVICQHTKTGTRASFRHRWTENFQALRGAAIAARTSGPELQTRSRAPDVRPAPDGSRLRRVLAGPPGSSCLDWP